MEVKMINEAGLVREVKVGFSWTAFFFGPLPFFFRGMQTHAIIWIVISIVTSGLSNLVLMFIINKMTAHFYLENGYKPDLSDPNWEIASKAWGICLPSSEN
jgi:hypothetical protein